MTARDPLTSRWFTALNGLIAGSAGMGIAFNSDGWVVKLTVILMAVQCEIIRFALRTSERERLATAGWSS